DVRPQDHQVRPAVPRVPAQAHAPGPGRRRVRAPRGPGDHGGPARGPLRPHPRGEALAAAAAGVGADARGRRRAVIPLELTLVVVGVCLVLEAFFSGSEIAVVSANRAQLRRKAEEGDRAAKLTLEFIEHPQRLLATTLLGTNMSVVISTTVVTLALLSRWRDG